MKHFSTDRYAKRCWSRTLGDVLLAVTPADADTVDNVSLFGLVSQPTGLIWARRTRGPMNNI